MPVAVHCPTCGQELVAPDELIGRVAACPGCNAQFPISEPVFSQRATPPPPPPSTVQLPTPDASQAPDAAPPPVAKQPASALPKAKPTAARAEPEGQPARPKELARPKLPASPAAAVPRAAQPARFIAGESTDTTIALGQDGQLPMLVLTEGKSEAATDAEVQKSNPLLLVVALCFSLLASLSMLLVNPASYYAEPDSKNEARAQIESHYVKGDPLREPYQDQLAAALQAHHKQDYDQEREHYKRVLKMLHEENKNPYTGVTGRVSAPLLPTGHPSQPNDEHLDSLLRTLLR